MASCTHVRPAVKWCWLHTASVAALSKEGTEERMEEGEEEEGEEEEGEEEEGEEEEGEEEGGRGREGGRGGGRRERRREEGEEEGGGRGGGAVNTTRRAQCIHRGLYFRVECLYLHQPLHRLTCSSQQPIVFNCFLFL